MPATAAFVDYLRAEFGAESVDPSIRAGLKGDATFCAEEAGHQLGTPATRPDPARLVSVGAFEMAKGSREST
jgi:hypothetical protein